MDQLNKNRIKKIASSILIFRGSSDGQTELNASTRQDARLS